MRQRNNSSGKPSGRVMAGRLVWPALFSISEVWAVIVVLTQIRVADVPAAALAFVVAGVVLVVWSELRDMCEILGGCHSRPWDMPPSDETGEMSADLA